MYWTENQVSLYKDMCKRNEASICLDATGSLEKKIFRGEGKDSGANFYTNKYYLQMGLSYLSCR